MSEVILITGGRDYFDMDKIYSVVEPYAEVGNVLLQGGATGADELAARVWHHDFQLPYATYPAPWNRAGVAAGPMRNMAMVKGKTFAPHAILQPTVVLAFPGGRGTANCIRVAEDEGLQIVRVG